MAKSLSSAYLDELTKQMVNDSEGMMFSADDVVDSINYSILEYVKATESCPQYTSVNLSVMEGEVQVPMDTLRLKRITVINDATQEL